MGQFSLNTLKIPERNPRFCEDSKLTRKFSMTRKFLKIFDRCHKINKIFPSLRKVTQWLRRLILPLLWTSKLTFRYRFCTHNWYAFFREIEHGAREIFATYEERKMEERKLGIPATAKNFKKIYYGTFGGELFPQEVIFFFFFLFGWLMSSFNYQVNYFNPRARKMPQEKPSCFSSVHWTYTQRNRASITQILKQSGVHWCRWKQSMLVQNSVAKELQKTKSYLHWTASEVAL